MAPRDNGNPGERSEERRRHSQFRRRSQSPTTTSPSRQFRQRSIARYPQDMSSSKPIIISNDEPSFHVLYEDNTPDGAHGNTPLMEITGNSPASHNTASARFHHQSLKKFVHDLNNAARSAFPNGPKLGRSRYQSVHACLIMWEQEECFSEELKRLDRTFGIYGFSTETWLIPSTNASLDLMRKALDYVREYDGDRNLLIVYYAGHGRMGPSRQSEWVSGQAPGAPSLDWSAVQSGVFAQAKSDVLLLLDTCAAASSVTTSQCGVMEAIVASGFESKAAPPGEHSFTNALIEVMEDWIDKPSFSVSFLHTAILDQLKQKEKKKGREGIRYEWCFSPIHIRYTRDHTPGIELCRRHASTKAPTTPRGSQGRRPAAYISPMDIDFDDSKFPTPLSSLALDGKYKFPHVLIRLQLEEDQSLDGGKCAIWLEQIPLLTKWARVELVCPSYSSILILSLPMPVWDMLPDHPACSFLGYVTAPAHHIYSNHESLFGTSDCHPITAKRGDSAGVLSQYTASSVPFDYSPAITNFTSPTNYDVDEATVLQNNTPRSNDLSNELYEVRSPARSPQNFTFHSPQRDEDGNWRSDPETSQPGLNPKRGRKVISLAEVPTLNEEEGKRSVDQKNDEVKDWILKCSLNTYDERIPDSSSDIYPGLDMDLDIRPVDDNASTRENTPKSGLYYNAKSEGSRMSEIDMRLIVREQWQAAPRLPQITSTRFQPESAAAAMRDYKEEADRCSVISRVASWGTCRQKEAGISELEDEMAQGTSIGGSFLLQVEDRSDHKSRIANLVETGFGAITSLVRKGDSSKKHSLTGPTNDTSGPQTPPPRRPTSGRKSARSVNKTFAAMRSSLAMPVSPTLSTTVRKYARPRSRHHSLDVALPGSPGNLGSPFAPMEMACSTNHSTQMSNPRTPKHTTGIQLTPEPKEDGVKERIPRTLTIPRR